MSQEQTFTKKAKTEKRFKGWAWFGRCAKHIKNMPLEAVDKLFASICTETGMTYTPITQVMLDEIDKEVINIPKRSPAAGGASSSGQDQPSSGGLFIATSADKIEEMYFDLVECIPRDEPTYGPCVFKNSPIIPW